MAELGWWLASKALAVLVLLVGPLAVLLVRVTRRLGVWMDHCEVEQLCQQAMRRARREGKPWPRR